MLLNTNTHTHQSVAQYQCTDKSLIPIIQPCNKITDPSTTQEWTVNTSLMYVGARSTLSYTSEYMGMCSESQPRDRRKWRPLMWQRSLGEAASLHQHLVARQSTRVSRCKRISPRASCSINYTIPTHTNINTLRSPANQQRHTTYGLKISIYSH